MSNTFRVAGWGTLGFSIAFFVTFVVNAAVSMVNTGPDLPLAADMAGQFWFGVMFMPLWGAGGIAIVVAAQGLSAVVWPDGGLAARISASFGTIAGAGWLMSGAAPFVQRTPLLNGNIDAAAADPAAEAAVVKGLYALVHYGGVLLARDALVPWIAIVAVGAARRRRMSTTTIVFLWIGGITPLAGFLVTGAQFGLLGAMLGFAVAGALLLRRARVRGRADSVTEAAPERPASTVTGA